MPCVHAWRQEGRKEKSPVEEFHARPFFFLSAQVSFHCVGWLQGWKNIEKFKRNHAHPWAVPACSRQARNNPRKAHKNVGFLCGRERKIFPLECRQLKQAHVRNCVNTTMVRRRYWAAPIVLDDLERNHKYLKRKLGSHFAFMVLREMKTYSHTKFDKKY